MSDIFISYSSEDRDRILPLVDALEKTGWSVFWDRTIPAGKTWRQFIGSEIKACRSVVVVWTEKSVTSRWVEEEAENGARREILIPVLFDKVEAPFGFGTIQAANLVAWDGNNSSPTFSRLVADIAAILGPSPAAVKETEERRRLEAESLRKAEEERLREQERLRSQEEARRKVEEENRRRIEEERNRAEQEAEQQRLEAEGQRKAEEERLREQQRQRSEEEAKRKAEEDNRKRVEEEKNRAEREAEQQRLEAEAQRKAEEERLHEEERQRSEEEAKRKAEEDNRKHVEEEKNRAEREAEQRRLEAKRKAEAEEQRRIEGKRERKKQEAERRRLEAKAKGEAEQAREQERQRAEQEVAEAMGLLDWSPPNLEAERQRLEHASEKSESSFKPGTVFRDKLRDDSETRPDGKGAGQPDTKLSYEPGTVFRDKLKDGSQGPEMVVIPAGAFIMGNNQGDWFTGSEKPVHQVKISKLFAMGRYQVTFEEYDQFAKATGRELPNDQGWGRGRLPVINVSWNDAVAYVEWLSQQTAKRYRLPTEAEWEYAARAGTETRYWWGNEMKPDMAHYSKWTAGTTPVGSFKPNPFGLYDTAGNVKEWVQDCWHGDHNGAPTDGSVWGPENGGDCAQRVIRGGSWFSESWGLRSSDRNRVILDNRDNEIGFRLAQDLD